MLCFIAFSGALMCRPAWYAPAPIDRQRLDQDNRDLVNLLDRIGVALNNNRAVEFQLGQHQVNRWIASREEWPEAVQRVDLGPIVDPVMLFASDSTIRIGCVVALADLRLVVSGDLRAEIRKGECEIAIGGLRIGAVPIPRALIDRMAGEASADNPQAARLIRTGRTTIPNRWVWPNGKRRFRIAQIAIAEQRVRVRLEPV